MPNKVIGLGKTQHNGSQQETVYSFKQFLKPKDSDGYCTNSKIKDM